MYSSGTLRIIVVGVAQIQKIYTQASKYLGTRYKMPDEKFVASRASECKKKKESKYKNKSRRSYEIQYVNKK